MAQIHAQTETAVANEALSHLLLPGIADLVSDTTIKGITLRLHFAATRDAMLRSYPWNFAERFARLNALPDVKPAFRFRHAYALPNAPAWCLQARELEDVHRKQWKVQGRQLLCNHGPCVNLVFTALISDVAQWDALFRTAFGLALAVNCGVLCKDRAILQDVAQKAADALPNAEDADAQEGTQDELPMQDVIGARF